MRALIQTYIQGDGLEGAKLPEFFISSTYSNWHQKLLDFYKNKTDAFNDCNPDTLTHNTRKRPFKCTPYEKLSAPTNTDLTWHWLVLLCNPLNESYKKCLSEQGGCDTNFGMFLKCLI